MRALAAGLLVAVTVAAFLPVLGNGFVIFDDGPYVFENRHVKQGVTVASVWWAVSSFHSHNWHPLTWISHMIDWEIWGPNPLGHHLASLLLHAASVCVLFLALDRLTGATWRSAFVAALFAVHPLHVESVAWIAERKDVLSTLFWFLALWAYAPATESPRPARRALVLGLFVLGLASKPMVVTLPFTLLLLDGWPLGRFRAGAGARGWLGSVRRPVLEKLPMFALTAAAAAVTVAAQHAGGSIATMQEIPLGQRLSNAAVAAVTYLGKTLWPTGLAVLYPHPGPTLPAWKVAGALALLVLLTAAAVRLRRSLPHLLFGWLWYLGTLVPVIGIVQVGEQAMADRYTYVPLVGIFVAIAWGAHDAIQALARTQAGRGLRPAAVAGGAAVAVVLALAAATRIQAGYWRNDETLFSRALAVTERNPTALVHLCVARGRQGRYEEAVAYCRQAVSLSPNDPLLRNNLGSALFGQGKADEALEQFREALRLNPRHASAHMNLGLALLQAGQTAEAVPSFDAVLRVDAENAEAHDKLGVALARLGRSDEAIRHFAESLRLDPERADTHYNWGTELASRGRYREASERFSEAIRLQPGHARAHYNLGAALFMLGDLAGAWRETKLARLHGFEPPAPFVAALSARMPEPAD